MKTFMCLAICFLTFKVESQFIAQGLNFNNADPSRIYFEDSISANSAPQPYSLVNPPSTARVPLFTTKSSFNSNLDILASVQTAKAQREKQIQEAQYDEVAALDPLQVQQPVAQGPFTPLSQNVNRPTQNHMGPASTDFGVNVFKQIAQGQSGNIAVSPYSISILLALLQQGASGGTLDEITRALHMTPEQSATVYKGVTENISKRSSRNILKSANNIFLSNSFNLNTDFKRIAVNNFGSDLTPTSFGNPALAANDINRWISEKTNNKIEKLLSPDSLSTNTQLVMVNAVYFKGLWEIPFREKATKEKSFHLANGNSINAKFMRTRRYFKSGVDKNTNAQVIALPFEFNEYSYIVILPHQSSNVDAVLSSLTMADVASYLELAPMDVELELPKFTIRADTDLRPVLSKLGVSSIFSQQSELFRLGAAGSLSPQVSSAVHSAVLSIDEKGGSAAAATSFAVVALSYDDPSVYFRANRPFIAILWDNKTSIPLFMARIMDPTV